ncbi:hypothetical protein S7711_09814 [Stachybotrys chartarum IBT 7711]|uniref:Peptidase S1A alpha-lytic prodomain domain-containing protein n=1 Tax=Stachybotrys chartarum (strain CBS 109288 / IBT 7711) TaxID=1280523 RepID=A0A084BBE1_STACB|nr:hypothetical protein S7711_09814 [Stachybotrys chartarum IBT 7711]
MELTRFLAALAVFLPTFVYGAPTEAGTTLHPEMLAAMKRDLGLDAAQATARVAREAAAAEIIEQLTLSKLEEAKLALDNLNIEQPQTLDSTESGDTGIASYYVDVESNKLVFEALFGSVAHAKALAKEVGLSKSEFEVRTVQELPSTFVTVRGGDAYYINRCGRCSVGFTVTTGFVTAGHCGSTGDNVSATLTGPFYGSFAGSSFPNNDLAWVRTISGTTLLGYINGYGQGNLPISGSIAASIGASAQGVTSGGSGKCASGGLTYFQPVNEILAVYGLTLVRA